MRGEFLLDDRLLVSESPFVHSIHGLYRIWFTTDPTDYWPMTNTSFWLEWRLWGSNPTGYHITNLILHIAAVCMIWAILRELRVTGAYLAAFLFAVHPVNVESVSWISQRKNTLAMVFFLLSIWWYLKEEDEKSRRAEEQARGRLGIWYWMSLLAFLLAMLSKGSVAVLPGLLLAIVWWRRKRIDVWDVLRTVPFFLIAGGLAYVNVWFQKHGNDVVLRSADFLQRLAGAGAVVWFYLAKALAPVDLMFIYPNWIIETRALRWWLPLLAALALTAILARQVIGHKTVWPRALLFGWLFFCIALVPVLGFTDVGFMQYSLVADHYQHIAIIAVVTLAAAGCRLWIAGSHGALRSVPIAGTIAVTAALTYLTWQQNHLYCDPLHWCEGTLERNPDCWQLQNDVGVALRKIGRTDEAIAHYKSALRLNPNYVDAHYNYGNALFASGQTQGAIEEYQQVLRLKPDYALAHDNLGSALAQLGRLDEAVDQFEQGLRLNSDSPISQNNLGKALGELGKSQQAIAHFQEALRLKPDYAEAHNNLGVELSKTDRPEAFKQLEQAVRLDPKYAEAHNNLAGLLLEDGRVPEAIEHYRQALQLKSSYIKAYANLAKAYAQADRRADAIDTAEKGLELARSQGQLPMAQQIESWLMEYRAQSNGTKGSGIQADHPSP